MSRTNSARPTTLARPFEPAALRQTAYSKCLMASIARSLRLAQQTTPRLPYRLHQARHHPSQSCPVPLTCQTPRRMDAASPSKPNHKCSQRAPNWADQRRRRTNHVTKTGHDPPRTNSASPICTAPTPPNTSISCQETKAPIQLVPRRTDRRNKQKKPRSPLSVANLVQPMFGGFVPLSKTHLLK